MAAISREPDRDDPEHPPAEATEVVASGAGQTVPVEPTTQEPAVRQIAEATDDDRDHRFECLSCGFVYDPAEGIRKQGIEPNVAFADLDPVTFRCPVCRSRIGAFKDIGPRNKPSGFEENLGFGLGVNQLTPGQKNVLIFGAFALAFAFFLSLYSLR
jgi:rubredoxin